MEIFLFNFQNGHICLCAKVYKNGFIIFPFMILYIYRVSITDHVVSCYKITIISKRKTGTRIFYIRWWRSRLRFCIDNFYQLVLLGLLLGLNLLYHTYLTAYGIILRIG